MGLREILATTDPVVFGAIQPHDLLWFPGGEVALVRGFDDAGRPVLHRSFGACSREVAEWSGMRVYDWRRYRELMEEGAR